MSGTKWVLCVLAVAVMGCFLFLAQDEADADAPFNEGSYTYEVISGTNVQVNGFSSPSSTVENVVIPDSVTHSGTTYTVVKIKANAFDGKTAITSVTISNSITEIGSDAFKSCTGITSFQFGTGIDSGTVSIGLTFKDSASGSAITDGSKLWKNHYTKSSDALIRDSHVVTLHYQYGTESYTGKDVALKNGKISEPSVRPGYKADGWFTKSDYTNPWNFNNVVETDMDLYAKVNPILVTNITINNPESDFTMQIGSTLTVSYTVTPSNALNKNVTITSSNTTVAEFKTGSQKNVLTAKTGGTTEITIAAMDGSGVTAKKTVTVISGLDHTITVTFDDDHGTASANKGQAKYGEEVSLAYTTKPDYEFKEWKSSDVTITNNKFIMPDKAVTIEAVFKAVDINITVTQPQNGTIYCPDKVEKFTDLEISVLAKDGFIVNQILIDGQAAVTNQATCILKNVTATHTVSATFTAVEGAKSSKDPVDGSITQKYEFEYGPVKLDVIEKFWVDGSAKYITEYPDAGLGIDAELVEEIDAEGKSEGYGICEVTYIADKFTEAVKKAEEISSAMAHYRGVDTVLAIDVTSDTGDKPIDVTMNIESYDGSYLVQIEGDIAAIGMDKTAMSFLKNKSKELKVSIKVADKKDMTSMQAWIVEDYKTYAIDINGIHSFDGKIRLAVPLVLGEGQSKDNAAVYYVGLYHAEKVGGTYDEEDQIIEADLPHLSYYFAAVDYKESPTGKPSGFSIGIFAVFLILIILLLAACVTFAMNYDVDSGKLYLKIPAKSKK